GGQGDRASGRAPGEGVRGRGVGEEQRGALVELHAVDGVVVAGGGGDLHVAVGDRPGGGRGERDGGRRGVRRSGVDREDEIVVVVVGVGGAGRGSPAVPKAAANGLETADVREDEGGGEVVQAS